MSEHRTYILDGFKRIREVLDDDDGAALDAYLSMRDEDAYANGEAAGRREHPVVWTTRFGAALATVVLSAAIGVAVLLHYAPTDPAAWEEERAECARAERDFARDLEGAHTHIRRLQKECLESIQCTCGGAP